SSATNQIAYAGNPLASHQVCYWKVMAWDAQGKPSGWSKAASWTMGMLKPEDWKAKWIGFDASRKRRDSEVLDLKAAQWIWTDEGNPLQSAPIGARWFRKSFDIPADRPIASVICGVTADDGFTLFVNTRLVRTGNTHTTAACFEMTDQITAGKNVLAIEASNAGNNPNPAGMILMLRVNFKEGEPLVLVSDNNWRYSLESPGANWTAAAFDDAAWKPAKPLGAFGIGPWTQSKVVWEGMFLPPAQYLRKNFTIDKPVRRATVYATALGNYKLNIGGRPVGDEYFSPGWTDYNIRVYYNTYDVTGLLNQGENYIGAILADGWYGGHIGWGRVRDHYGKNTRFAAQLRIEYADGSEATIVTDETWKARTGRILEADFLMGETFDARKPAPFGRRPNAAISDQGWNAVDVTDKIEATLQAYPGVPVRKFQEIKPVKITEPVKGTYVYDMGTNFAGFARLKIRGKEGQKITLRYAERLNPDGTMYTTNLRGARATDTYICRGGNNEETWQPQFTFHGFQYVELTGVEEAPTLDAITGIELTSATPVAGLFESSDAMANQLYHNICQTQRANFIDIPTDCPQRDERLGWTGDAQIYVRTATNNTDTSAFYTKWLVDLEDAQGPRGDFPDVAPRKVAMGGGTAAWGDAGVICPWTVYQVYGDRRVLEEHYDAMVRWVEYCKGTTKGLLRPAEGYGDWLSIKADTPKDVLATAYFAYSTMLTAKTAEVLGKTDDAAMYRTLFEQIREAFNKAYVAEDGRIKGNTQTVYVLGLAFDLLPEAKRAAAVQYLVEDIQKKDWHLSTGFVGTKDLMMTLYRYGRLDVAYRLFQNDTFPSWGFSIKHGATSIWERWDGWTPENGFQDPGMNSFAHYSFGAVCEWMFKTIGGIDFVEPGYERIVIRPIPGGRFTWAKTQHESIRGRVATDWKLDQGNLTLKVEIPANTTAMVYVPAATQDGVSEKGNFLGAKFVRMENSFAVYEAGSGSYEFVSKGVKAVEVAN
ncbi:MAG: family 78 glycoside hydrolase catalytic domain, partial [Phycisphaerae bacterium]|nr:family 78 glycoside hydrolase catalytic domain [Phycisphaerae bacterium]